MADRNARDFAPVELTAALTEVTACMRVYRTYIREGTVDDEDRSRSAPRSPRRAAAPGRPSTRVSSPFLERVLLVDPPSYVASEREHWLAFVMRWQQFTGRVMAKGVEDTAFYNYNRLISLNEVGGDPGRGGDFDGLAEFHARNAEMQRHWPHTMNATSTHDTKRSEDVARASTCCRRSPKWERQVRRWSKMNAPHRANGIPDPNEELLIYQTLIGMWPLDEEELPVVRDRLRQYLEKAARAKRRRTRAGSRRTPRTKETSSTSPARSSANQDFRASMMRIQKRVAFYGFLNGLSQVVLKIDVARRARFLSGNGAVGFQPRRSRQPPPGRLRATPVDAEETEHSLLLWITTGLKRR